MTLPPDPGSLRTTSLQDQSDQLARAQLLEQEAAKQAANITAAPGSDDFVFAQKAADDARFYAGRQIEEAQGFQARYMEEKQVVDKYNEQVMRTDKDHDGRSDFTERREAEAAAPFKALGTVGAGLVGLELTNEAITHPSALFGHKMAHMAAGAHVLADAKIGADVGPASAFEKLATPNPIMAGEDIGFSMRPTGMMNSIAPAPENRDPAQAMSISPQSPAQMDMASFPVTPEAAEIAQQTAPVIRRPRNQALNLDLIPTPRPNSNFFKQNGGGES